ncbi:MAG: di-heme oxidoredictase family protein [Spongiibacteraceae bacterium]
MGIFRRAATALTAWFLLSSLPSCTDLTAIPNELAGSYSVADRENASVLLRPQPGLSHVQQLNWAVGKSFAIQPWVSGHVSTTARDGLGPLFNANACSACHHRNGQGKLPPYGNGLILRFSDHQDSQYGAQLQDRAVLGVLAEGRITTLNISSPTSVATAQRYRKISVSEPQYGEPPVRQSARLAPALIGMGLIDAIDDQQLYAAQDPDDRNHDGISGRVNEVWDIAAQASRPGRFGWRAEQPTLHQQIAAAFSQDMGIRSSLYPQPECPATVGAARSDCRQDASSPPEISDKLLTAVSYYIANLAVPVAALTPSTQAGQKIFTRIQCANCHQAKQQIKQHRAGNIVTQNIFPFSDFLLHDMGEDLADNSDAAHSIDREWRTAPLWGLGLRNNHAESGLLHDGRAATIHQAVLWHGGEAQAARQQYSELNPREREQLLFFLKAL